MGKTIAEGIYEKGIEQGWEQGREQGREQGKRETLIGLLRSKFESVPTDVQESLANIPDSNLLEDLAKSVLRVNTLDEFRSELAPRTKRRRHGG